MTQPSLFVGVYMKNSNTFIHKDICTPMFIAALFAVAKTWRQPVSFDGGLDKEDVVHIYNGILLSHKKR